LRRAGPVPKVKLEACKALLEAYEGGVIDYGDIAKIMSLKGGATLNYAHYIVRELLMLGILERVKYGRYKINVDKLKEYIQNLSEAR